MVSGGVVFLRPDGELPLASAVELAGLALERARHDGRNTVSR